MNSEDKELLLKKYKKKFKNNRLTPHRELILEIFLENEGLHLSAEEVFSKAKKKDSSIGFATVYRNLDLLNKLGILYKLNLGDGKRRYELNTAEDKHQHHHLICLGCDKIIEVKWDLLHSLEGKVEKEHDFEILERQVKFYGYCSQCRSN